MATIDDKVVAMSFESSKFESGVNKTIASLDKLKKALNFGAESKSFHGVASSAKAVDLGHIAKGAEGVKAKLGALNVAAVAIFANIAGKAVAAGAQIVKALTIDPIKTGFAEYSTNLNAVQTILANTQAAGVKLPQVNAALKELNEYSDRTIYNFSQMAKNIGTFTAAGVELKTATGAIKGIANLAALSGSNSEQASTAMYQLSQAISAGSVKLQDWNSVVNAGMGGTVFQRALAQTAEKVGTLDKGAVKLKGSMKNVTINGEAFRQSLSTPGKASWLTSDVLTKTLKQFTGDLSDAELAAQGFNKAEIKAIQATAKTAMHAATEVKTIQQAFEVAKETAGSGWAETFQIIFGTFGEAKKTFTELSETINGFINANADARNKVLADWKALGGRTVLINAIKTAFHNLAAVVKPIKDAFRDIFPAITGKNLYDLTLRFKEFAEALKPSEQTVENLRRTFRGLFAILDIAKMIIFGVVRALGKLLGVAGDGTGGFLKFTAAIGDWLVKLRDALARGDRLYKFFDGLGTILSTPIKLLQALAGALSDAFGGVDSGGISKKLSPVQKILEVITGLWDKLLAQMGEAGKILQPLIESYANFFEEVGIAIVKALTNMNFDAVLQVVRTGLFAGIFLMFKKFLGKGSLLDQFSKGFAGGIMKNISQSFGALSGSMKALQGSLVAMQQNIKAKTLKEIAIAVALLAVSVLAISLVDPKKLSSSLTAITVMFGQLLASMAVLGNVSKSLGFIKMPIISASLIILAGAITALSFAVLILSRLSWEELLKGLGGVAALLGILIVAVGPLGASSAGMIRAGIGITALAIGLNLLALAVRQLGTMNLTELAKGLGSVAVGLGIIVKTMKVMPKGMVAAGAGIILLAVGLRILANAVEAFGRMSMATIAKGLLGVAGGLIIIGVAMRLMPKGMILQSAGLLLIAVALQGIAKAIGTMGGMSIGNIAKALGALAVTLTLLALAVIVFQETIGGAIALALVASGIALLAGALKTMGAMSWESIIKSLVLLAAALTIIGIAGALITPVIPSLLGLGVALLLIGAGLALAGAGIALIGVGLSALVVAAPSGFGILLAAIVEFQQGLIKTVKNLVLGMLEIVKALAEIAPQFVDALVEIINSLIDVVLQVVPKLVPVIDVVIAALVKALDNNQDKIIKAGLELLMALLTGIRNYIGKVAKVVVEIIANLLRGIANNISKIIAAGAQIVVALLRGIASAYAKVATAALSIISKFLSAIGTGLAKVATAGLGILTKLLGAIANNLGKAITAGTNVIVNFIKGVGNAGPRIIAAATNAMIKFINALSQNAVKLADAGAKAIINFLNGVATVIETREPEMIRAGFRIGTAIVRGMINGLTSLAPSLTSAAKNLANKAKDGALKALHVKSPSKVFYEIGQSVALGFANGMSDDVKVVEAATAMSNGVITAVEDTFQITSPSRVMIAIARLVTGGFATGLREGTVEDINSAVGDMRTKLTDAMASVRQDIAAEQAKLREERAKSKKDRDKGEIRESIKNISDSRKELALLTAGHRTLTKTLNDERTALVLNAQKLENLNNKLDEQKQKLEELKQVRDDAHASYKAQYGELPDVTPEDEEGLPITDALGAYKSALTTQIEAVATYASTLQQLRELGLDDETYKKLLEEGPQAQAFATQLLQGGATAVQSVSALSRQLTTEADKLGAKAAANLYQAGVNAQQAIVNGLTSDIAGVKKAMERLATEMISALKKKLKIKSPSKVFEEIGVLSMEGMAKGFSDSTKTVTDAVDQAAQDALVAMQKSMGGISGITDKLNPVITPILDLTQVESEARRLAALTNTVPITAAASFGQASAISSEQARVLAEQTVAASGGAAVQFQQNNYSPSALSEVEIYRQTKNQLSQLKSALALT